jgi:hypothetical protein
MFKTEKEFYPTPDYLIDVMLQGIDINKIKQDLNKSFM